MEPVALAGGLRVALLDRDVEEVELPPRAGHLVMVSAGPAYRLQEALDGAWRATPGVPGDVAVVPAGAVLAARSATGRPQRVRSVVLEVPTAALAEPAELVRTGAGLRGSLGGRSPAVAALAGLVHDGLADTSDTGRLSLDALGRALLLALLRDHGAGRLPEPAGTGTPGPRLRADVLQRVLAHVEDHLGAAVTLDELAAVAHLSPFHFARAFRASTGASPHQHVLARRAERARELLEAGRLTPAQVAAACGFADQSHLGRVVRRRWGTTPAALRPPSPRR